MARNLRRANVVLARAWREEFNNKKKNELSSCESDGKCMS